MFDGGTARLSLPSWTADKPSRNAPCCHDMTRHVNREPITEWHNGSDGEETRDDIIRSLAAELHKPLPPVILMHVHRKPKINVLGPDLDSLRMQQLIIIYYHGLIPVQTNHGYIDAIALSPGLSPLHRYNTALQALSWVQNSTPA